MVYVSTSRQSEFNINNLRRFEGNATRLAICRTQIADMLAGTAACCKKPEVLIKILDRRKKIECKHSEPSEADAAVQCDQLCRRVIRTRKILISTNYISVTTKSLILFSIK